MSRLIVKSLPVYVTSTRLRQHFEQKGAPGGTITDVQVPLTAGGTSRRIGFIGFKTNAEAEAAKEYFNKTFVGSSRIQVELVDKDARPRKRRRIDHEDQVEKPGVIDSKENNVLKKKKDSASQSTEKPKPNKHMEEFMEVMQTGRRKGPAWADGLAVPPVGVAQPVSSKQPSQQNAGRDAQPQDELEEAGQPPDQPAQNDTALSDIEWMKRHMSRAIAVDDKAWEQSDEENVGDIRADLEETNVADAPSPNAPAAPDADQNYAIIQQTRRLFVRNLAFTCTEEDLRALFMPFDANVVVHIPSSGSSAESSEVVCATRGIAYATFSSAENALAAYDQLDKSSFQGRLLHILGAVDQRSKHVDAADNAKPRTVKDEKQAKRKTLASKSFNWAMLYMNSDAVASSVADRMSIPKAAILNPESSDGTSAAVKLALAETHIIQETKSYLENQGVSLEAFASSYRGSRSDTTILVKNIPYGTSLAQIEALFTPHGTVQRLLLPPAGTIAVVQFAQAAQAAVAFRSVAYKRLGSAIVYLEWAPGGLWAEGSARAAVASVPASNVPTVRVADESDNPSLAAGTTLFVKNLSFATTTERLCTTFGSLEGFVFARVQTKAAPPPTSGSKRMGYGFIGFSTVDTAKNALQGMQGIVLDGHQLVVKFAGRGAEDDAPASADSLSSKSRTTKMIVKNVPFEATKRDIRDLFAAHGQLKSVRLPKKFDARTRGFAFLEFVSRQEAENAFKALRHTHLLGRHLVLEWAEEGEQDLDALRQKMGVGFGDGKAMPNRKRKLDLGGSTK
ncbi:hypothetical protein FISHEDRAFT_18891, partial [Fistulina hepatica ATCC 64428]